jgi:hypothetical protein
MEKIEFKITGEVIAITVPIDILTQAAERNPEVLMTVKDKNTFAEKAMFELEHNLGSVESGLTGFQELLDRAIIAVVENGEDCVELTSEGGASEEHIHIPNDYGGHATFSSTPTEETINAVNKMTELAFKNIEAMADETTAASEAIMFAEWIIESGYTPRGKDEWCFYSKTANIPIPVFSSTQFYRIYKEDCRKKILAKAEQALQENKKRAKNNVRFPHGK